MKKLRNLVNFGSNISVSAIQNRGLNNLMDVVLNQLPKIDNDSEITPLKVAIVGKPNVGKSSYINRLLKNDRLYQIFLELLVIVLKYHLKLEVVHLLVITN